MTVSIILVALTLAPADGPQRTPDDPADIIVTGERQTRSLRATTSSAVIVNRRTIERAVIDRLDQLLVDTPNVQQGSGGELPTIRGQDATGPMRDLPAFLGGNRPRMTLVVDGRALSYNELAFGVGPLWDVDRIEIFRTPQSSSQGQNAIAGAVFVTTVDPTMAADLRLRAMLGQARTRQLSLAGGGPLIDDQLAMRIVGDFRRGRSSSALTRRSTIDPNRDEYDLVRIKLLATPKSLPGTSLNLGYTHNRSQSPQLEGLSRPFRDRVDRITNYGIFRVRGDAVTAQVDSRLAEAFNLKATGTFGRSRVQRFAPPGLGETMIHQHDWSAEMIAQWRPAERFNLLLGTAASGITLDQHIDLSRLSGIGVFSDRQHAFALFGEAEWKPVDRATMTLGLRYQQNSQIRRGTLDAALAPIALDYRGQFNTILPKLSAYFDVSEQVRIGAFVQKAANAGGTTLRFDTGQPDTFDAESLWDKELFVRLGRPGGAWRLNMNLFAYRHHNAQRSVPIVIPTPGGAPVTFANLFNVPRARTHGIEIEGSWRVVSWLDLSGGLGLLDTKILDGGVDGSTYVGKQFQRAPKLSASASVAVRPIRSLSVNFSWHRNSGYFSEDSNLPYLRVPGWSRIDGRIEYSVGRYRLFGYARNAGNRFALTYLFKPQIGTTPGMATAIDPRELGIGLEFRYGENGN